MLYSGLNLPIKHNLLIPRVLLQIRTCLKVAWSVKTPRQRVSSRVELPCLWTPYQASPSLLWVFNCREAKKGMGPGKVPLSPLFPFSSQLHLHTVQPHCTETNLLTGPTEEQQKSTFFKSQLSHIITAIISEQNQSTWFQELQSKGHKKEGK